MTHLRGRRLTELSLLVSYDLIFHHRAMEFNALGV